MPLASIHLVLEVCLSAIPVSELAACLCRQDFFGDGITCTRCKPCVPGQVPITPCGVTDVTCGDLDEVSVTVSSVSSIDSVPPELTTAL
jgi:hypothetical protein